jgi:hypothetical protein
MNNNGGVGLAMLATLHTLHLPPPLTPALHIETPPNSNL